MGLFGKIFKKNSTSYEVSSSQIYNTKGPVDYSLASAPKLTPTKVSSQSHSTTLNGSSYCTRYLGYSGAGYAGGGAYGGYIVVALEMILEYVGEMKEEEEVGETEEVADQLEESWLFA